MRTSLIVLLLSFGGVAPAIAEDWGQTSIEGFWVDLGTGNPSYGNTYISIMKISETNYLVVASSTRDAKHLSFFGRGTMNKKNALIVHSSSGSIWSLSRPNADEEILGVWDDTGEYNVAQCRRVQFGDPIPLP